MTTVVDMLAYEQFYGSSPPTGFLNDYTRFYKLPARQTVQLNFKNATRSCIRDQKERTKKKVVFADDRGLALEHVKIMSEPSHIPPFWAMKIVSSPPAERKLNLDVWEMKFKQPASDYVEFRRRITEECVSLENLIVKQYEGALQGTVKVKNLDFNKEVIVRTSSDGWRTHEDTYCGFHESGPMVDGSSIYDTFAFFLQLPVNSRRMELCICFKCKDEEFWDSNNGSNYVVERSSVRLGAVSCARVNFGNSWSLRTDSSGTTPYW